MSISSDFLFDLYYEELGKCRHYTMQIMTGIEVNSEAYFPQLREYCPSAKESAFFSKSYVSSVCRVNI